MGCGRSWWPGSVGLSVVLGWIGIDPIAEAITMFSCAAELPASGH